MRLKKLWILPFIFTIALILFGCSDKNNNSSTIDVDVNVTSQTKIETTPETTPEPPKEDPVVRVVAVGDNLIHSSIYNQAKARSKDGGYDFSYAYQHVEKLVSPADIAVLNQETPIANNLFPPSTYPLFNSPTQLGDQMLKMGFNVVSHCNNHILDKGEKGMLATLDYWNSKNTLVYGAYRNQQEMDNIPIKEVDGIKFSFVGFMEHTNGLKLPEGSQAKLVYTSDFENMKNMIEKANKVSDVVVVSVHWGTEISNTITQGQKDLAKLLVNWGADVIIGTQPHTIQSMEYLEKPDGGEAFVFYSLGNFISAQDRNLALVGILADFNVTKSLETNKVSITDVKAIPVITHYGPSFSNVTAYPYDEYNEDLAKAHGVRAKAEFSMTYIDKLLTDNIPPQFLYLK